MKNPLLVEDVPFQSVRRGGSWYLDAGNSRVSLRSSYGGSFGNDILGFRLFRSQEKS